MFGTRVLNDETNLPWLLLPWFRAWTSRTRCSGSASSSVESAKADGPSSR